MDKTAYDMPLSVTFVRHGQTAWNAAVDIGAGDNQLLTDIGKHQASRLSILLKKQPKYDAIISSPLTRALQTASVLHSQLGISGKVRQDELLAERDYGLQQPNESLVIPGHGYNPFVYPEFVTLQDSQRWAWKPYEDFESDNHIIQRYVLFSQRLYESRRDTERNILCVTHSGFMRILLMHYGYIEYKDWNSYAIANTSAYRIDYNSRLVNITCLTDKTPGYAVGLPPVTP